MTVNERLYVSGLMNEFDLAKKTDIQRAIEILQEVGLNHQSIRPILKIKHEIPNEILLQAFCNYYSKNAIEILNHWNLSKKQKSQIEKKIEVDKVFAFSKKELLNYLKRNNNLCDKVIIESYDKRSTSSTFISEKDRNYIVGFYDNGEKEIKKWREKHIAVADYLLLSWNLNRID